VVDGGNNVEFEFTVRGGLEDTRIDLDLLDTGTVEFFESGNNARFLACTRRAVYEEMWKVPALCLASTMSDAMCLFGNLFEFLTRARRRSESSGW